MIRKAGRAAGALVLAALLAPSAAARDDVRPVPHVSVIQLIADPETYHDKQVRAVGYVRFGADGSPALYLSQDTSFTPSNGLLLDLGPELLARRDRIDGRICVVEGIFDLEHRGSPAMFQGVIGGVTSAEEWRAP
jgi:hypothetical protein